MARPIYTHLTSVTTFRPLVNRSAQMDTLTAMYNAGSDTVKRTTSTGALVARHARC
jgi:hypothetical protein